MLKSTSSDVVRSWEPVVVLDEVNSRCQTYWLRELDMKNSSKPWWSSGGSSTPMMSDPDWTATWLAADSLHWKIWPHVCAIASHADPWASIWISCPVLWYEIWSVLLLLHICSFGYIVPDPALPDTVHPTRVPLQVISIPGMSLVSVRLRSEPSPLLLPSVHDSRLPGSKHESACTSKYHYYIKIL